MNQNDLSKISAKLPLSKATLARNADALAGLRAKKPEPDQRGEGEDSGVEAGPNGARYRVTFTIYRRRLLDVDNHIFSLKPVRDRVAIVLGFIDDADPRLSWHYHQIQCDRDEGTSVRIERL